MHVVFISRFSLENKKASETRAIYYKEMHVSDAEENAMIDILVYQTGTVSFVPLPVF